MEWPNSDLRMCHCLRSNGEWQMVNFFWNLGYHTKLSTSIGGHDTQASPRVCCDSQIYWTFQHQRDVFDRKSLATSPLLSLSGLHVHRLQFVVINLNNEVPIALIGRVIRSLREESVTLKKSHSIPILWERAPRTHYSHKALATHMPLREWIISQILAIKPYFLIYEKWCLLIIIQYPRIITFKFIFKNSNHHELQTKYLCPPICTTL